MRVATRSGKMPASARAKITMLSKKLVRAKEIERSYKDGEWIVREGEQSKEMFVIQAGRVEITKRQGDRQIPIAQLGKGDFFGEMSVLESLPRDASVRSLGDTSLLVVSAGGLLVRMRRDPTFAFEMLHRLSGRVRSLNARLIKLIAQSGLSEHDLEVMIYNPEEAPPSVRNPSGSKSK